MIAPLSLREIELLQLLVNDEHDADMLLRLRNVLIAMYASHQIAPDLLDDLMTRLTVRYSDKPELALLHEQTRALLAAARSARSPFKGSV